MSSPESGYIVLEFIRGPEVDEPEPGPFLGWGRPWSAVGEAGAGPAEPRSNSTAPAPIAAASTATST